MDPETRPLPRFELTDSGRTLALSYQFRDRATAMAFLGIVACLAEHAGACPKIEHLLGRVRLGLTTYEQGSVTANDHRLAGLLEKTLDFLEHVETAA